MPLVKLSPAFLALFLMQAVFSFATAQSGIFTLQVGTPPPAPTSLVRSSDLWRYHKGTNRPPSGWQTAPEAALDGTWATGGGGFGFAADNPQETAGCQTVLPDMFNLYSTLYLRRTFEVSAAPRSTQRLLLTLNWDDGFVAYLDGVEVARFNAPGAVGVEPAHSAVATAAHESANGNPENMPQPPMTFDLGPAGHWLAPGSHVLAVLGLNRALDSTDFILMAELTLTGGDAGAVQDGYFALVKTNAVTLSGSNTFPNSTRVMVNGLDAEFNLANGTWSRVHSLEPNLNRLFIAALDAQGRILASTNKDVVSEMGTVSLGGTIAGNTVINASNLVVRLTNHVLIGDGARLSFGENSIVLIPPDASLQVQTNGALDTAGVAGRPVHFLPADGVTRWQGLFASGANASITLRHAEIVAGEIRVLSGSQAVLEDCVARDLMDYPAGEGIAAVNAVRLTLRRTHLLRFAKVAVRETAFLAEDCLLEHQPDHAFELGSTSAPLAVLRTTLRHGAKLAEDQAANGVELGPSNTPLVENCLIHDFGGRGISIDANSHGARIRNTLIYQCDGAGVSASSSSPAALSQSTISGCSIGLLLTGNPGSAFVFGTNSIIWGNQIQIGADGAASARLFYSDVQGGAPGEGNINDDLLFVNPAAADFRLGPGSPALDSGLAGAPMGVAFPVGGIPPAPFNLAAITDGTNQIQLAWEEAADNESAFLIERSENGTDWAYLDAAVANSTNYVDRGAGLSRRYFYRVRAENAAGLSPWSNVASRTREPTTTQLAGTLARSIALSPRLGHVVVTSNLIVPANISLTVQAGTVISVTNGASIVASAGGTIDVVGEAEKRVFIAPLDSGNIWGELSAQGAGASLRLRYADIAGGQTTVYSNAVGVIEDSSFHDYRNPAGTTFTLPIMLSSFAGQMTVRRCHFREYYETLFRDGVIVIEDSLFEYISGDALDFDGAQPGTTLRRCTFRHGIRAPSNIDAVDVGPGQLGPCRDVLIEDCLMFDFPTDKGVSIGDAPNQAMGTIVRNCLIYGCHSGVQVKDAALAQVYQCTIVSNRWGLTNYNKANPSAPLGGGHTTNAHNNILWGNNVTISMWNSGTLAADHCNFGNTNWPGVGNTNLEPQFVNAALGDYRLGPNSPCRGAGRDGADLGAQFPVGAPMAASHPSFASVHVAGTEIVLRFWADHEKSYSVEAASSLPAPGWTHVASVPSPALPRLIELRLPFLPARFYRLAAGPAP